MRNIAVDEVKPLPSQAKRRNRKGGDTFLNGMQLILSCLQQLP